MNRLSAIAAHRFGLGEAHLQTVGNSPQSWLLDQIGPADPAPGLDLLATEQILRDIRGQRRTPRSTPEAPPGNAPPAQEDKQRFRELISADVRSRLLVGIQTQRPFVERLFQFWANHFTVSVTKGSARGLVGVFEREAIRPHIAGSFEQLLWAATTHPAMLRYLDNHLSAGPRSQAVAQAARRARRASDPQDPAQGPRLTGLNENLARELLELHTLGAENSRSPGGYTQSDVTSLAKILTGWRPRELRPGEPREVFDPSWHEPGPKTVLSRTYPEGSTGLRNVIGDLARHPATAQFIAWKLARHFVADSPPQELVQALRRSFLDSGGHLPTLYRTLAQHPQAWSPSPSKLKTPEEFLISTARLLDLPPGMTGSDRAAGQLLNALRDLKQVPHTAPSPAGWSDLADDWLGPEALWKRLEWSARLSDRLGRTLDARALGRQALGPSLSEATQVQLDRAADGPQALALLLMSPEWQRR